MTRLQFLGLRLVPTVLLLTAITLLIRLLWFPGAYFGLAGITGLVWLMIGIGLVVGPGLTTLIFRPGKRGLLFDIVAIACVEAVAIGLMAHSLYERRPEYTVFAVDRFEVVTRPEVDSAKIAAERLRRRPGHAPRLVFARLPEDPADRERLLDETVFMGLPDIDRRPEFWHPYASGVATVRARARPIRQLLGPRDPRRRDVARWLAARGGHADEYAYLPLRGKRNDAALIVHARIGYPIAILSVDPW